MNTKQIEAIVWLPYATWKRKDFSISADAKQSQRKIAELAKDCHLRFTWQLPIRPSKQGIERKARIVGSSKNLSLFFQRF